jgi:predicted aspartyl protease
VSQPYLAAYTPPIPALEIALRLPEGRRLEPVTALVDTGADATIVPIRFIQQLGIRSVETAFVRTPWDERRPVEIYILDIQTEGITLPGVDVVGDEVGHELILGRNVLNKLILLLNGPALTTTISSR